MWNVTWPLVLFSPPIWHFYQRETFNFLSNFTSSRRSLNGLKLNYPRTRIFENKLRRVHYWRAELWLNCVRCTFLSAKKGRGNGVKKCRWSRAIKLIARGKLSREFSMSRSISVAALLFCKCFSWKLYKAVINSSHERECTSMRKSTENTRIMTRVRGNRSSIDAAGSSQFSHSDNLFVMRGNEEKSHRSRAITKLGIFAVDMFALLFQGKILSLRFREYIFNVYEFVANCGV